MMGCLPRLTIGGLILLFGAMALICSAQSGQIAVDRVEMMPNVPSPYNLRDWRDVAIGYDSFVYDINKTGEYLPLISIRPSGVNYPGRESFGMHSYVGTNNPDAGEAINILPSLVGATLCGINKRDHYGRDWILLSQDYFNKNNGEFVYLNNRGGHSGSDWWYDMMPNIYFYQLYDLFGEIGEASFQFTSIADQMLSAVRVMGGSAAPWSAANMNYRAFDFLNMEPNPGGVHEPEAAGAFAWLLYNAYTETGNKEYLKGAEWSIEFLNNLSSNPSYELQLPYGVYTAARMNAELQTEYNMDKLVSWVFERGPLRGWGTIVGKWGSLDVSGLVGEANDNGNDYAFQMNGIQQAAAMVPMTRYDKRFARAIARWFLNMANATRLMFPRFLPAAYQDATDWSNAYDPDAVIGYEALREQFNGFSPFSTGDAVGGGWAGTNLALYGTSSIGYLGALYQETNVDKILLLNLLKTDFLRDTAYPSYLVYNPLAQDMDVEVDVGTESVDIYDAITESFLAEGVSGVQLITVPADEVRSIVLAPAGGTVSYNENLMLINDVVVDFQQHIQPFNTTPRIQALDADPVEIEFGDTTTIYATAIDRDSGPLVYSWSVSGGTLEGEGDVLKWIAPDMPGSFTVELIVEDETGLRDTAILELISVAEVNVPPVVLDLVIDRIYAEPDQTVQVTCIADDPNGDPLTYVWNADDGNIDGSSANVTWTSPSSTGIYTIGVEVSDDKGAKTSAQINILVNIFQPTTGDLIAQYPFDGDATDHSGNDYHGTVSGAKLAEDRFGQTMHAYNFDGVNDHITVANASGLNFIEGITVSCWIEPITLPDRETFVISHGSWQNRWKISITPERRLRWTVRTSGGSVRDVDSFTLLETNQVYQVTVTFDGELMILYLDGRLEGIVTLTGKINTTSVAMEIGQMLPDNQEYNFRGIIDDISIYNYALHPDTVAGIVGTSRSVFTTGIRCYPVPVKDILTVEFEDEVNGLISTSIIDREGRIASTSKKQIQENRIEIPVNELITGLYFLMVRTERGYSTASFVKLE